MRQVRVDHTDAERRVLSTQIKMGRYDDKTVVLKTARAAAGDLDWQENTFAGVEIVAWDRTRNKVRQMYDMFDYASPDKDAWLPVETTWTTMGGCKCSGDYKQDAVGAARAARALTPSRLGAWTRGWSSTLGA